MPRVPTYIARTGPPPVSGKVKMPALKTAEAEIAYAQAGEYLQQARESSYQASKYRYQANLANKVLAITRTGYELLERLNEARVADQFGTAITNTTEDLNNLDLEFSRQNDYTEYQQKTKERFSQFPEEKIDYSYAQYRTEKYEGSAQKIREQRLEEITNRKAKEAYEKWFRTELVKRGFNVAQDSNKREIQYLGVKLFENLDKAVTNLDKKLVTILIRGAVADGILYEHDAERYEKEYHHEIDLGVTERIARGMGFEEGIKWLNSDEVPEDLSYEEIKKIEGRIRTDWGLALKAEQERHERVRNEQNILAGQMYIKGELTLGLLERETNAEGIFSDFEDSDVRVWINMLESRATSKGKDPSEISDPLKRLEFIRLYADPKNTRDFLEKWLRENVGPDEKGDPRLSAEDYLKFYRELDIRKPNLAKNIGLELFKEMEDDGTITKTEHAQLLEQFEESTAGKEYTAEEYRQIAENIADPPKRGAIKRLLGRLVGKTQEEWVEEKKEEGRLLGVEEQYQEAEKPEEEPGLKEYEVIIIDQEGNEWIFNKKTGEKRRV